MKLNKVVWSDKVNFSLNQIFEVQDSIGDKILTHLQINAVEGGEVKSWAAKYGTAERLTLFLNSRKEWFKFTPDGYKNHTDKGLGKKYFLSYKKHHQRINFS